MDTAGVDVELSPFSFEDTIGQLHAFIERRQLRLFGVFDHRAAAAEVGLALRPTTVFAFGSPNGGTPLMERWPSLALELPLRIAVWEDDDGQVVLAHLTARTLTEQFRLDPNVTMPLGVPAAIVRQVVTVDEAAGPRSFATDGPPSAAADPGTLS